MTLGTVHNPVIDKQTNQQNWIYLNSYSVFLFKIETYSIIYAGPECTMYNKVALNSQQSPWLGPSPILLLIITPGLQVSPEHQHINCVPFFFHLTAESPTLSQCYSMLKDSLSQFSL